MLNLLKISRVLCIANFDNFFLNYFFLLLIKNRRLLYSKLLYLLKFT